MWELNLNKNNLTLHNCRRKEKNMLENIVFWGVLIVAVALVFHWFFPGALNVLKGKAPMVIRIIVGFIFGIIFVFPFSLLGETMGYIGFIIGFIAGFLVLWWIKFVGKFFKWLFKKLNWWVKLILLGAIIVALIIIIIHLI